MKNQRKWKQHEYSIEILTREELMVRVGDEACNNETNDSNEYRINCINFYKFDCISVVDG